MQETPARMEIKFAILKVDHHVNYHQDNGQNIWNQWNQMTHNVDGDLGIKLVIPEYDGKLKSDEFMDWLVCLENILHTSQW